MHDITADALDALASGADVLAGGGASPWPVVEPVRRALVGRRRRRVRLVDAADLDPDALVVPVGMIDTRAVAPPAQRGTDDARLEHAVLDAVRAAEDLAHAAARRGAQGTVPRQGPPAGAAEQRGVAAVVPLAMGGPSPLAAVLAAAVLGVPCVDGDGLAAGPVRLAPTLFSLAGVGVSPVVVADGDGAVVTVRAGARLHPLAHAATVAMGGLAAVAGRPVSARRCAAAVSPGSLGRCVALGAAVVAARRVAVAPGPDRPDDAAVARALAVAGGRVLMSGRVVHVARASADRGTVTVEAVGGADPGPGTGLGPGLGSVPGASAGDAGHSSPGYGQPGYGAGVRTVRVDVQDGALVVSEDGVVLATAPDVIAVLDAATLAAVPAARLAAGSAVHVVAAPADDRWRGPLGLAAAGPAVHGYDIEYHPLHPNGLIDVTSGGVGSAFG